MPKFFMMVGLPGSGKSYEAKRIAEKENAIVVSTDAIRAELFGSEDVQTEGGKVFELARKRVKATLASDQNVIFDATNVSFKRRMSWTSEMRKLATEMIAVVMATPYAVCVERQSLRDRKVEKDVIRRMYRGFFVPYYFEGWDEIRLMYPENISEYETRIADGLLNGSSSLFDFDQKNPHHKGSLGEHMLWCFEYSAYKTGDRVLKDAALLHDIGKVRTQTFDDNGVAHYYGHHCVSGYESLFECCCSDEDKLLRAFYVQNHMEPYFWKEEKTKEKYRKLWGEKLYNDIQTLHTCDKMAH